METLQIKIINRSENPLPAYATVGSSGMDLRAALAQAMLLKPMQRVLVPTGIYVEIPIGYEAQIRPRSGLAINKGLTCLNTPGTIDSDYRGEVKVILVNLSGEEQMIEPAERIAQMVIQKVFRAEWCETDELEVTQRNEGGFGHTGTK
jgi:dUTP pyrophosphatase